VTTRSKLTVIVTGEALYLVPNTLGCASECWKRPQVTVVSTAQRPVIAIQLPDDLGGAVIHTHEDNLARTLPSPPTRQFRPRPAMSGAEEIPLW
jgi:hypothetical protein